jgi:hypothetical protein
MRVADTDAVVVVQVDLDFVAGVAESQDRYLRVDQREVLEWTWQEKQWRNSSAS